MVGGPGGHVEAFQVGQPGLGVGPGEEQQRLDDPPEPDGVVVEPVQDALVLLDGARRRRATSIAAIRAASGVRSWCDAWPVNCFCRSSPTFAGEN